MLEKLFESLGGDARYLPNKLTTAMGKKIREARLEANMSQAELAEKAYFKQSSISKIESGDRGVSAEDLLYLCFALNKPILYFFPKQYTDEMGVLSENDLAVDEQEFISIIRQMKKSDFKKLMAQARALMNYRE